MTEDSRSAAGHPDTSARVSVIVPAWNAAHSIRASLDSILGQTLPAYEVIVVNDGSTDDTVAVVQSYGDAVVLVEQENEGQGAARNLGLDRATGDYVAFLDADDFWKPEFLQRTVAFLNTHSAADVVSCAGAVRGRGGRERIVPACVGDNGGEARVLEDFFRFWAAHDHVRTGTVLIRRRLIDAAGAQCASLRISQDLEYWGYLATFGTWGFIPEVLWVGNSREAARATGWSRKYRARRRLCPDVESWESRIAPRVTDSQRPHFEVVRGRVAAGYAHAKLVAGDSAGARVIVHTYGDAFPPHRMSRLMCWGDRVGRVAWWLACGVIRLREKVKG